MKLTQHQLSSIRNLQAGVAHYMNVHGLTLDEAVHKVARVIEQMNPEMSFHLWLCLFIHTATFVNLEDIEVDDNEVVASE